MLGYVSEISPEQLKRMRKEGYVLGDRIGQSGVEAAFDKPLPRHGWYRGGPRRLPRSAQERLDSDEVPKPGDNLRLTIDVSLQRAAERALQYGIARARGRRVGRQRRLDRALDPNNGDILAMASYPTFRPSVYTGRDDEKLKPLLDAETARREKLPG